jgi:DNA-binding SARP family transcriptional activator
LTAVVAATGYGKSTVLASWADAVGGSVYRLGPRDRDLTQLAGGVVAALRLRTPGVSAELAAAVDAPLGPDAASGKPSRGSALAGALCESLSQQLTRDLVLVIDGMNEIADAAGAARFVETIVRSAPPHLHVVVTSRDELPFPIARLRQGHEVLEFNATDLALSVDETAQWLGRRLGDDAAKLAARLHTATGGWPAATHAAIDAMSRVDLAQWPEVVGNVSGTSAALSALTRHSFDSLPVPTRRVLQAATVAPMLTDELALTLGAPVGTLATVSSKGPFLDTDGDGYQLTPTSAQVLREHAPLLPPESRDVAEVAARWYVEHDSYHLAMRTALAADHHQLVDSLLSAYGEELVDHPEDLLTAFGRLGVQTPQRLRMAGLAQYNRGDWDTARELLTQAADQGAFDASVAYRIGVIDHLRGELETALEMYRRGTKHGTPRADAVMCTAMAAAVCWLRGDRNSCATLADEAREGASRLGDHRALAAAHTVLAMLAAYDGDGRANDAHYLKALDHAGRAGDVIQQIRIRSNRASHRHTEGAFAEALAELEIAIQLCDLTGFTPWAALARSNRAETLLRVGRLEEAAVDAGDAVARWTAMGSRLLGYGLIRQAQIHALRGFTRSAEDGYKKALELAEQAGDAQGIGNALTGLARLVVRDVPEYAAELARRASDEHVGTALVDALLVGAQAAIATGRSGDARRLLDDAEAEAVRRNERGGLAALAELRATLDNDAERARDAIERWTAVGDPVGIARAELLYARFCDPAAATDEARDVQVRMHAIGCHALDDEIEALTGQVPTPGTPHVVVQTLGTFRVVKDGDVISTTKWQSRKARDLLKVLITRRGRPMPREQLVELLWPDDDLRDAAAVLKRLNVMVSTLRGVLDPDHESPPDHIVASAAGALHLELANVNVDIVDFLAEVAKAAQQDRAGNEAEALAHWRAAEAGYTGDFCEEDAYADWATGLREEARLAYAQAAAQVAGAEASAGNFEQAARFWLRLLERDQYDERAHLGLVRALDAAGRRGDARRRYQAYADLMRELDIEPSPHPT